MEYDIGLGESTGGLTRKQLETLVLKGKGLTDAEVSEIKHREISTIHTHIHHLLQNWGAKNIQQALTVMN